MKCPQCLNEKRKSKVYPGSQTTTFLPDQNHWDENELWHVHNPNTLTTPYTCSNGHAWKVDEKFSCLSCDWKPT